MQLNDLVRAFAVTQSVCRLAFCCVFFRFALLFVSCVSFLAVIVFICLVLLVLLECVYMEKQTWLQKGYYHLWMRAQTKWLSIMMKPTLKCLTLNSVQKEYSWALMSAFTTHHTARYKCRHAERKSERVSEILWETLQSKLFFIALMRNSEHS